jgi:hypothetical protein
VVPRLPLAKHRGQPLRRVGLDHPREEVEPRLVLEDQGPALAAGAAEQFRPGLVPPALDRLVVPLDRLLRCPVQALEYPADMVLVVADAELPLDDLGLCMAAVGRGATASIPCRAAAGKLVRSWALMRHLLKVRRRCEVPGHDDTEGVQDSLSAFGGESRPEAA